MRACTLERAAEQLKALECAQEQEEEHRHAGSLALQAKEEECAEALEAECARQRAASSSVLRRFRCSQYALHEARRSCLAVRARKDAIDGELAGMCKALQAARAQKHRQVRKEGSLDGLHTCGSEASVSCEVGSGKQPAGGLDGPFAPDAQGAPASLASDGVHSSWCAAALPSVPRTLPSASEMRQRIDGRPELHSFYLQVFPLLRGTLVEIFRRPTQRFEARQLLASSDLQRLELWPPVLPSTATGGAAAAAAESGRFSSGPLAAAEPAAPRSRRVAESFVRVDGLARVHIPKTTLTAVQQSITDMAEAPNAEWRSQAQQGQVGPPLHSSYFPFNLMLNGAEPWRLLVTDVRTFHVVTAAISTLLAARESLPSFALALGLGQPH